jgi:hypothetical protein
MGSQLVHETATMQSPQTVPAPLIIVSQPQLTDTTLQRLHLKTNSVLVNFSLSLKVILPQWQFARDLWSFSRSYASLSKAAVLKLALALTVMHTRTTQSVLGRMHAVE